MTLRACVICGAPSEAMIPDGRVCRTHAIEFYEALLAYAHEQPRRSAPVIVRPGPRVKRTYVKRHPRWFKVQRGAVAA